MPPLVPLQPYQAAWVNDQSRFKLSIKSRQIGLTFADTLEVVLDCFYNPGARWFILSASERQARDAIEQAAIHCQALKLFGTSSDIAREELLRFEDRQFKATTIEFPYGPKWRRSKITALPANPRTARGVNGNLLLEEFAHQLWSEEIWKAAFPIVTRRGYKLRVVSTPNGMQGKYWDLVKRNFDIETKKQRPGARWSVHWCDVYTAIEQGFEVDLDLLREEAGDDETFEQEYCCAFLDESKAWLPYSLIESCTDADGDQTSMVWDSTARKYGDRYAGFDIARKRDLFTRIVLEEVGTVAHTRGVFAERGLTFDAMEGCINETAPEVNRLCIDTNGIGAQLGEQAVKRWGEHRVEAVDLNGSRPAKLASKLKRRMERRRLLLPNDPEVRRDLHSLRRVYTDAGNARFEAPRTKAGHADRFWGYSLAVEALEEVRPRMVDQARGDGYTDWDPFAAGEDEAWESY